jgi:glycosyltransferase involved in cell wall biosynthesis
MPNVSDDKFMLTGNGINAMDFRYLQAENLPRDPHRIFYGSSYDRGLEHLLKMWPDIRKEVPDATLHVCYGWNLFESFYANNPERMAWKAKMDEMMTQEGITNLGRISQLEVLREQFQSAVWAYPTHFGEISCITAMKSQAAGAIPVVTNYAALDSTVQYGVKVPVKDGEDIYDPDKRKEFSNALIGVLKDEQGQKDTRKAMMEWAQENFAWENVAKQWDEEFKRDPIKEAMDTVLKEKPSVHKFMPAGTQKKYGKKETY